MGKFSRDNRQSARLAMTAVRNLRMQNGVTLKHISNYIKEKYPNCASNEASLRKAIENAVAFGALKRMRNKFMLGSVLHHIVQSKRGKKSGGKKHRRRRRRHH